jgi:hypothetical protein
VSGINLTRSQSDDLIVQMAMDQPYIAAAWRGGEPIVFGFGKSEWAALNMARLSDAPKEVELCVRIPGELSVWQGPSGRRVTVENLLTLDD